MTDRRPIRPLDVVREAFGALGANKLRSALTVLGITVGVFSIVGVMTALTAIRTSINSGLAMLGANVFEISREPAIRIQGFGDQWWRRPRVFPDDAYRFKRIMEEAGVPVTVYADDRGERVTFEDRRSESLHVIGTNENYLLTQRYEIAYGRGLSPTDIEFNRPVIVISATTADALFFDRDPIGQQVVTDGYKYTVIGVLEPRGELFGNDFDAVALIPVTRFVANNWNRWRSMNISVQAPTAESLPQVQDLAVGQFRLVRGLEPEDSNDFEVYSNDSLQSAFARIANIVSAAGLGVSAIALVCAGIGIMNIMLVSVTERTREIGIRKAIGARKNDVLKQFLLEAVVLSEAGAVCGILIGIAVGNGVAHFLGVPMIIPWSWMVIAVGVCSGVGIVFGLFPAWQAARLDPIEALRRD
ncbi:MAG: ABC transporter permease [Opitutales bacterium]